MLPEGVKEQGRREEREEAEMEMRWPTRGRGETHAPEGAAKTAGEKAWFGSS